MHVCLCKWCVTIYDLGLVFDGSVGVNQRLASSTDITASVSSAPTKASEAMCVAITTPAQWALQNSILQISATTIVNTPVSYTHLTLPTKA